MTNRSAPPPPPPPPFVRRSFGRGWNFNLDQLYGPGVYMLVDMRGLKVRYVGQSLEVHRRFQDYLEGRASNWMVKRQVRASLWGLPGGWLEFWVVARPPHQISKDLQRKHDPAWLKDAERQMIERYSSTGNLLNLVHNPSLGRRAIST